MSKKISKKKATAAASSVLKSVFGKTTKKCSTAGSKLAADKSKAETKRKAGSTLGSNTCKAPARRKSFTK